MKFNSSFDYQMLPKLLYKQVYLNSKFGCLFDSWTDPHSALVERGLF